MNFQLPDDIHQAVRVAAVDQRISIKEYAIRALTEKLERDAKTKKS